MQVDEMEGKVAVGSLATGTVDVDVGARIEEVKKSRLYERLE